MADDHTSFDLLKSYPGIIHRQPIFTTKDLSVDYYQLAFLDTQGNPLNEDSEVPAFVEQLAIILPTINEHNQVLLSIPQSWHQSVLAQQQQHLSYILNSHDSQNNNHDKLFSNAFDGSENNSNVLLIDQEKFSSEKLIPHLAIWRKHHATLCATNVNSFDSLSWCQDNNLDQVQGQFYTLAAENKQKKISPSSQILMQLLVKLQNPDVTADELADLINLDVSLSYKLLRLINSAFFGLNTQVDSTKQAILLLGQTKIKTWISLLGLSGMDNKPKELRIIAMTRAKMCELLAKYYKGNTDLFFATGLFSSLDALMDKPLAILLEKLPLSAEIKLALNERSGIAGRALEDVLNYEHANWQALSTSALPIEIIARAYLEAIRWTQQLNSELHA